MPVKVEGRRIIRAPVQKVFQLVSRLDAAPRVTGLWFTADLVERKSNSLTVHFRGYFAGIPVESIQRAILHPPHRIEFRQSRGNLKAFHGQYQLKPIEGDTEITLTLEAEVGITLVSDEAARLVLHSFIERSLEKFKLTAERDLPRVVRKAASVAAAKEPAPPEGEEASATPAGAGDTSEAAPTNAAPTDAAPRKDGDGAARPRGARWRPSGARPPALPAGAKPGTDQSGGGRKRRKRRRRRRGGGDRGTGGPASGSEPGRGGPGTGLPPG